MINFRKCLYGLVALLACQVKAVPGTDISLFKIHQQNHQIKLSFERSLVVRKGYDNQPSFSTDSSEIYFTRMSEAGNTDIWKISLKGQGLLQLTDTVENEYSPTPLNKQGDFSAVIAYKGNQSLWRIESGKLTDKLSGTIAPVGYHTWVSDNTLAMFRLAEPHELVVFNRSDNSEQTVASDIGRCLVSVGDNEHFFYVQHTGSTNFIKQYSLKEKASKVIIPLLDQSEDFAWHPSIGFIHSNGNRLFVSFPPYQQWDSVSLPISLSGISRLSISPDGQWLAVVHSDLPQKYANNKTVD